MAKLLLKNQLTVSFAESCTGGMIAGRFVNVPGVSGAFGTGYVTYSNQAKRKLLGVKKSTLKQYGAVSSQTAKEMAEGALAASGADMAVSVTGIAGPDGGTKEKPVGLVYIGCCVQGRTFVREYRFLRNREKIRESTVAAALTFARSCLLEHLGEKG